MADQYSRYRHSDLGYAQEGFVENDSASFAPPSPLGIVWQEGDLSLELTQVGAPKTWADVAQSRWADSRFPWTHAYGGSFKLRSAHLLDFEEAITKSALLPKAEAVAFSESLSKSTRVAIAEALGITESYVDHIAFVIRVFESLQVSDNLAKTAMLPIAEAMGVTDSNLERKFTLSVSEAASFVENFGRAIQFRLKLAEDLTVQDALARSSKISKAEAFQLFEDYVRRANAVISDMILSSGDLTFEDFMNTVDAGKAPGYAPFRDFIPGDYTYQDAIFRAVLESVNSDRATVTQLKLVVDVPDILDRGSVVIPAGSAATGVRVLFNRKFNVVPEITLTLKGGTVAAVPSVTDPDLLGFTVMLRDPQTQTGVAGSLTWAAQGY